ncbi:hypothetical protein Tco_0536054 [Tanacetum coccineum]
MSSPLRCHHLSIVTTLTTFIISPPGHHHHHHPRHPTIITVANTTSLPPHHHTTTSTQPPQGCVGLAESPLGAFGYDKNIIKGAFGFCKGTKGCVWLAVKHREGIISINNHIDDYTRMNLDFGADGNLRELSGEEAWEAIENFSHGQKEWDNPPNIISEQELANLKAQAKRLFGNEKV